MYFTTFSVLPRFRSEQRGHEFDGIMRLQPGRLVGEKGVGAGMRFVEAVAGEFGDQVENAFGLFLAELYARRSR